MDVDEHTLGEKLDELTLTRRRPKFLRWVELHGSGPQHVVYGLHSNLTMTEVWSILKVLKKRGFPVDCRLSLGPMKIARTFPRWAV